MESWQSWLLFLGVAGAGYTYYNGVPQAVKDALSRPAQLQQESQQGQKSQGSKSKKKSLQNATTGRDSSGGEERSRKRKAAQKPVEQSAATASEATITSMEREDNESNDKEWAKQLASLKKGTSLAPPTSKAESRTKTVKQSAAGMNAALSGDSSTTGADADDDMSPAASSPAFGATDGPSGRDITDMLEPAAPGPNVLRLTESSQPQRLKKQAPRKEAEAELTKKQRQRLQKRESEKQVNQEAEAERRRLQEKQMRTAREARGEPAKNGLGVAQAPKQNAWAAQPAKVNGLNGANGVDHQAVAEQPMLDTFDPDSQSTASSDPLGSSATTAGDQWDSAIPSEEEQMRMLHEQNEDSWNTVTSGKKNKRKTTNATDSGMDSDAPVIKPAPVQKENAPPREIKNNYAVLSPKEGNGDARDSDWAVV